MPPLVLICLAWVRRQFAWSQSREAWIERLAVAVLLGAALAIGWYRAELSLAQEVSLWALLVAALSGLLRRGWLKLFGPVLPYELVRIARRKRYLLFRYLYGTVLLLMLCWMYLGWVMDRARGDQWTLPARELATFAEAFFYSFMGLQFLVLVVVAPAYTAGCIADEKDRKTLEFLLATDLRSREIVLSKLLARLANLTLFLLTGLPVLSLTQFWGGVDPNLVLAGFTATLLTMTSLASFAVLCSVYARKARDAIVLTYLGAVGYMALSGLSLALLGLSPAMAAQPVRVGSTPITIGDVVQVFNSGNIFVAQYQLMVSVASGGNLADTLPSILREYGLFHGVVALGCAFGAVIRMRPVALRQAQAQVRRRVLAWLSFRQRHRPRVGERPMLWKEIFAEPGLRLNWFGRIAVCVLVAASLLPAGLLVAKFAYGAFGFGGFLIAYPSFSHDMNIWVRLVGAPVACLTLLGVAVRAASSVSGERDRQTWDSLLTTPLDSDSMLSALLLGSVWSMRWGCVWLGVIWGAGVLSGGLHLLAPVLLVIAWITYAAVLAVIGLWYSITSRTTLRATLGTVFTAVIVGGGHWLLWMCCLPLAFFHGGPGHLVEILAKIQVGLTPPFALGGCFSFRGEDLEHSYSGSAGEMIGFGLMGLACWFLGGLVLGVVVHHRFRRVTGRAPHLHPRDSVRACNPVHAHGVAGALPAKPDETGFQRHEREH